MSDWLSQVDPAYGVLVKIALTVIFTLIAMLLVRLLGLQSESRLERLVSTPERKMRLRTLVQAGVSFWQIVLGVVGMLMVLRQFDIDIAPILASAGVAGLALSLGSQTFIRDLFGGVLILIENQFAVGDVIKVGDNTGTVERITLRATYLRDLEGRRISIPNGDIRTVINLSTEWSRAVITLNVPREANMEKVLDALQTASRALQADPDVQSCLLDEPQVQGWVDVTDTAVQVRLLAKTVPGKQWEVAQALRCYALSHLRQIDVDAVENE